MREILEKLLQPPSVQGSLFGAIAGAGLGGLIGNLSAYSPSLLAGYVGIMGSFIGNFTGAVIEAKDQQEDRPLITQVFDNPAVGFGRGVQLGLILILFENCVFNDATDLGMASLLTVASMFGLTMGGINRFIYAQDNPADLDVVDLPPVAAAA